MCWLHGIWKMIWPPETQGERQNFPILGDHESYIAGLPMALERAVDPDKLRVKDGISLHFQMTSLVLICMH
jgi:hypothetical protein